MTLAALLAETLARHARRVALVTDRETLDFATLAERARRWHAFLVRLAVPAGARVMIVLAGGADFVTIHAGNVLGGRITVPASPRLTARELGRIVSNVEPALVVCDRRTRGAVDAALAECDSGAHVLERQFVAAALASSERAESVPDRESVADDAALIVHTSGTTGVSKGVILTQGNLAAGARSLAEAWAWSSDDTLLLTLPLHHVHGLGVGIHGMFASGHRVVLRDRFDAEDVAARLRRANDPITLYYGVPTHYERLLALDDDLVDLSGLRLCVSGSAPLPPETWKELERRHGVTILERYGMSETLMIASNPLRGNRRPGHVGHALPGVRIRIRTTDDRVAEPGEVGEIEVSGANVTPGYWLDDDATRRAFTPDGWLKTGDLGVIDRDHGALRIEGRAKELIITGGFNVHPREVEEVCRTHPAIREAAAVGLPDSDLGEIVALMVVATGPLTLEELREHCRAQLASYKIPRRFGAVETLPRNALGKIQRHLVREIFDDRRAG